MKAPDLVRVARKYLELGVHEVPRGSNSGPYIDDWLRALGGKPGDAWCSAAACAWAREANGGAYPSGFHPSLSGMRLLEKNAALLLPRPWEPVPGDIVVWSHGHGTSHVGVVATPVTNLREFTHISGNTNSSGSREGYEVAERSASLDDVRIAGFVRAWTWPAVTTIRRGNQ